MIKAAPDFWGRYLIRPYFLYRFRKTFHAAYFWGWEHWNEITDDEPILAFANHCGWWDGIVLIHLKDRFPQRRFFCMMERLHRYPFFRRLGAYSTSLVNRTEAALSLRYTVKLLATAGAVVWIFPQGEILPASKKFTFLEGFKWILSKCRKIKTIPLALRYSFYNEEKPVVCGAWGKVLTAEACMTNGEAEMDSLLEFLEARTDSWDWSGARITLAPGSSINDRWDRFRRLFRADQQ